MNRLLVATLLVVALGCAPGKQEQPVADTTAADTGYIDVAPDSVPTPPESPPKGGRK